MSQSADIFSVRLVIADSYLEKPVLGLDPCHSEFRGSQIKKVPIIRIFGSNAQGQKTCMHVHGVFPYFYIPYEKNCFESLNKAIYQIAFGLDKAINVSLGQGSSATQHVFKIQLVKGIPFYGYHRLEHQYLKIYMYNPRFVRRAANLLQNGSILGKIFHPHESHVPYVLQFMIDYNLYGMSFVHVPLEVVKFRRHDETDLIDFPVVKTAQILNLDLVKKQSCSALEIDIGSNFILNRFQLALKNSASKHSNPGVEAIWHDEDVRRQKLLQSFCGDEEKINAVPRLEIPPTQERPNINSTESETFYRVGLLSKLMSLEQSLSGSGSLLDQTFNSTLPISQPQLALNASNLSKKEMQRTFNLKKLLVNSVYPEECTPDEELVNASCIENHLSSNNVFQTSCSENTEISNTEQANDTLIDESAFLDDTMVDEELIMQLTQQQHVPLNASLRAEDMELLDVLQQLEEKNEIQNAVDLDSSLAPLSQPHKNFELTPKVLDKETIAAARNEPISDNESDSENEDNSKLHDFSIALDDIDELLLRISQSQPTQLTPTQEITTNINQLPQLDGVDDYFPRTPEKMRKPSMPIKKKITPPHSPRTPKRNGCLQSPIRSPRTPTLNAAKKYMPLPILINSRSVKKTFACDKDELSKLESKRLNFETSNAQPSNVAIAKMRRKTISSINDLIALEKTSAASNIEESKGNITKRRTRKNAIDLEKTHITCALTPRRKSERLLKTCDVDEICKKVNKVAPKRKMENLKTETKPVNDIERQKVKAQNFKKAQTSKSKVLPENNFFLKKVLVKLARQDLKKMALKFQADRKTEKLKRNDEKKQVGKSHINRNENDQLNEKTSITDIQKIGLNTNKNFELTMDDTSADDNIKKNLSQLLKVFHEGTEKTIESYEPLCFNASKESQASISLNDAKINAENRTINVKASKKEAEIKERNNSQEALSKIIAEDDNIRKNLSQLTKLFQNVDGSQFSRSEAQTHNKITTSDKEITKDSDDEIVLSDTERSPSILKLKRSLNFKRPRQSFSIKNALKTPKTPTTVKLCDLSVSIISPSVFSEYSSPVLTPEFWMENKEEQEASRNSMPNTQKEVHFQMLKSLNSPPLNLSSSSALNTGQEINFQNLKSPGSMLNCNQNVALKSPQQKNFELNMALTLAPTNFRLHKEVETFIFKPLNLPPTREETLKACEKLKIFEYEFQRPFYSNPEDITKAKEVGFNVLHIPGNKLIDCPEFRSVLGTKLKGLAEWRREKLQEIGGQKALQCYKTTESMREFFATKKFVVIEPHVRPPTRQEAKTWLKARELLKNKEKENIQIEQDSPIKIRRQKVAMMFNDETGGTADNDADDIDGTSCSLILTPLTPTTPVNLLTQSGYKLQAAHAEQTPLSTNEESSCAELSNSSSLRCSKLRRPKRLKSVKMSLNAKLKAAADKEMDENKIIESTSSIEPIDSLPSSQQSNRSSDDSSSVCSQFALAELKRSSFVKRLKLGDLMNNKNQLDVSFGLTSASLDNTFGFKVNLENLQEAKADIECNYLTTIVLELFVPTRDDLYPNPEYDEIRCIFYAIDNNVAIKEKGEIESEATQTQQLHKACGYILVNTPQDIIQNESKLHGLDADIEVKIVKSEIEALEALLKLCAQWDADIYAGYEIEMSSWGYVIERAKKLGCNIAPLLSRVPSQKIRDFTDEERDQFTDLDVEMKLCGRILLDVWRLMRSEIALTSYTFENVMYHILHKRCPWHSYRDLTTWFDSPCSRWIVLEYYLERVRGILALLDQLDLLGRTSEMAKLIGIQFYEVLSRGSQFRVESMMLRIAKPRNLVPLSPSVQQRAHMRAPEYLPLILEPQSRFYADPVIVLDFQSLYPSMIIAYNYCFSTCLGRVEHLGQSSAAFEFGASQLRVSPKMLRKLLDKDLVNISPCGVVFVKSSVREGILPRMLTEILDTRQMVKQSMKLHKSNSALQRILHSRQLGLKLMANVTYGYTAANFSGRMPAVEVGDSVVAKGRETLERTIKMVEANENWGVKVVYGDTDSLFVQVPGRNREQAFKIGEEIAAAATKVNPHPVKLKLEKVYQPCILQTKKRYVGYMYESADQMEPVYEAKGIETVRRDGCPAVAKMLEKVLRILFETTDVSQVKQYVCRQFTKLLSGRANLQDLIFAKEFRGLNGYKPTACVPALEMTRKWLQTDPRRIPRRGERVPFIITNGPPGVPLIRLIRTPHEVLADGGLKINAIYYITKAIIPPLNRCLFLIGADANEWFANLPRKILMTPALSAGNEIITGGNQQKKSTISQYFSTTNCIIDCGRQTKEGICNVCVCNATKCVITLESKIAKIERSYHLTQFICQACCGRLGDLKCGSLDCPVLYVLEVKKRELQQIEHFRKLLSKF